MLSTKILNEQNFQFLPRLQPDIKRPCDVDRVVRFFRKFELNGIRNQNSFIFRTVAARENLILEANRNFLSAQINASHWHVVVVERATEKHWKNNRHVHKRCSAKTCFYKKNTKSFFGGLWTSRSETHTVRCNFNVSYVVWFQCY